MKKAIIFIILYGVTAIYAASPKIKTPDTGAWGVQARFSELTLKHFQGSLFSAQKFTAPNRTMRFGVSINWFDYKPDYPSTPLLFTQKDSTRAISDVFLQLIHYKGKSRLKFYGGGGPYVGFLYTFDQTQKANGSGWVVSYQSTHRAFNIGVSLLVGGEYFLNEHLSVMAEYITLLFYQYGRTLNKLIGYYTTHSWHINPQPVKIGVAVYF